MESRFSPRRKLSILRKTAVAETLELAKTKEKSPILYCSLKQNIGESREHLDHCLVLGDRPTGSIYAASSGYSKPAGYRVHFSEQKQLQWKTMGPGNDKYVARWQILVLVSHFI